MENGINIRLCENKCTADIDIFENGITKSKTLSLPDLEQCFVRSQELGKMHFNGLLPEGVISHSVSLTESYVVLRYPAQKITYSCTLSDTPYLNFPMPNLVFGILLNRDNMVLRTYLRVLPQGHLTLDSPLYYYPFANVHPDGEVCMGKNEALIYNNLQSLENYPPYVLALPNNDDLFESRNNKRSMKYQQLLNTLAKRKPDYYYKHVLVQVPGQTLKDFCTLGGVIE